MPPGAHVLFRKAIRGWFYLEERRALAALKPTVSRIGFYLHKDLGAAGVGILSAQRVSRGRALDFIYATNSARPGSDFIYTDVLWGLFWYEFSEQNGCCSQYNFRAARACSSEFIENNEWILTDIQSNMICGA